MPIDFNCQGCGKHYRVRDELAGRVAQCKNCGQKMTVPRPAPIEEPPEEEAADRGIGFADEEDSRPTPARQASRQPPSESYDVSDDNSEQESSSWGSDEESSQSDEMGVGAE